MFAPEGLIHRFRDFADTRVIECVGALEARERIDTITSDITQAVGQADYIIVCVTGNHHQEYAQLLKGHTSAEQIMVTFNGCMASLIYKNVWGQDPTCPILVESTIPPSALGGWAPARCVCLRGILLPSRSSRPMQRSSTLSN